MLPRSLSCLVGGGEQHELAGVDVPVEGPEFDGPVQHPARRPDDAAGHDRCRACLVGGGEKQVWPRVHPVDERGEKGNGRGYSEQEL